MEKTGTKNWVGLRGDTGAGHPFTHTPTPSLELVGPDQLALGKGLDATAGLVLLPPGWLLRGLDNFSFFKSFFLFDLGFFFGGFRGFCVVSGGLG